MLRASPDSRSTRERTLRLCPIHVFRHIGLVSDQVFIHFNGAAIGAERSQVAFSHGFPDTVSHEPGGLESNPKGSMKLVGAKALLGGRQQVNGLEPEAHRDVAIFKDGPYLDSKRFSAYIALIGADPGTLAVHFADALPASTVGANWTLGPNSGLSKSISSLFIEEMGSR